MPNKIKEELKKSDKKRSGSRSTKELPRIISNLPKLGKDSERFLKDIEEAIRSQPKISS